MRIWLDVKYADRHKALAAGAVWSIAHQRWFVDNPVDARPFMRWIPDRLKQPHKAKEPNSVNCSALSNQASSQGDKHG